MKTIKKPDLKGPRFRSKWSTVLTRSTLDELQKKHPKYKDLDLATFRKIVLNFNQKIAEGVTETRNGVELPEALGYIFMGTCPPAKKKNIDYKRSWEFGTEATHRNWDSDNKLLKIFYTNYTTKYSFQNKQVWAFKACKPFRKIASEAFIENWAMYIEVSPTEKISGIFRRARRQEVIKNLKPIIPEGYDEFKM